MSRLSTWLLRSTAGTSTTSPTPSIQDLLAAELADIEEAMAAAALIMNDDIESAEAQLSSPTATNSAFHMLGLGVCTFMRSILGFEKDIMTEASNRLSECETKSWTDLKRAQRESGVRSRGRILPVGSEYMLVQAQAQLMGAVVSVLHESLTEGIRGFYKLRKAYITLDGLMEAEAKALKELEERTKEGVTGHHGHGEKHHDEMPGSFDENEFADVISSGSSSRSSSFEEAVNSASGSQTPMSDAAKDATTTAINNDSAVSNGNTPAPTGAGPDSTVFTNPLDAFVHSGANMCFGILLLIISLVPPAFSKLLYVIGFKGDRDRGLKMLWQSSKFSNVNGAVAALILLTYYNGQFAFGDILRFPRDLDEGTDDVNGHPAARCETLMEAMRTRYPDSGMWRLEESRTLTNARKLHDAVVILKANTNSKMRQVVALNNFELSIIAMFLRDWKLMKECFLRCVELNDWSHALYYFMAGVAEVEMYRDAFHTGDMVEAAERKKSAEELLRKGPTVAGRKKFLARQMPFEVFVGHKISKWEARRERLGLESLVDAVGVSPAGEMTYLWNGGKRMDEAGLDGAEGDLAWERLTIGVPVDGGEVDPEEMRKREEIMGEVDEKAFRDVCLAVLERCRGEDRWVESRRLLEGVAEMDRNLFKAPGKDNYVQPCAVYELAVLDWIECCQAPESCPLELPPDTPLPSSFSVSSSSTTRGAEKGTKTTPEEAAEEYRKEKALSCFNGLEKVARWETFILNARIGLRVQTGLDNVRWLLSKKGWV